MSETLCQQLESRGIPFRQIGPCLLVNGDCLEVLPLIEAGSVDAVVTDPNYGISADKRQKNRANKQHGKAWAPSADYGCSDWDAVPAPHEAIEACRKAAPHCIIFGGNYFNLPPTSCVLVWDKLNGDNGYADCELAWTNLPGAVRKFPFRWHGMLRDEKGRREHPTQKPVKVMEWCMTHLPQSETILDPFGGVFTTMVACIRTGRQGISIEIDPDYYAKGCRRVERAWQEKRSELPFPKPPHERQLELLASE